MASGTVAVSDVVVPAIFSPYVQQRTEEKSRLIQSGAITRDGSLDGLLSGGGITFNSPSWKDLDNDADLVSSDTGSPSSPNKIGTATEIQVRLSRNSSWATADLVSALAGSDPAQAIASRVSEYWIRRLQAIFVATMTGVFLGNDTDNSGDMTHDVSGSVFADGVTNFTAEAFIDAKITMGDSLDKLGIMFVHSVVYARMMKNDLIDFIMDSQGGQPIPTFQGVQVIVDDGTPHTGAVYDTWLFGAGAVRMGMAMPKVPTEVIRVPAANNGGGMETLHNRHEWIIHPNGFAYSATAPNGGPSNAGTANNLAHVDTWNRIFPERKQVHIARLKTREY